jgi:protein TonB
VLLNAVVLKDGSVGDVQVDRSLDRDSGLDQAAVDAMKQWVFKPGTKDGKPVAVRIHVELTFSLR